MFRLIALMLASFTLAGLSPVIAQADRSEAIHDVISRQLDAIKTDRADVAFAMASPAIQSMFGNAPTFMSMVARGYPQIYRSRSHKFLNIDTSDGNLAQRVLVEGEQGAVIVRYDMIEIDGTWRINGCMIEKVDEA